MVGKRPGKTMNVNTMNHMNMLSSGNSAGRNENIAYMTEQNGRE